MPNICAIYRYILNIFHKSLKKDLSIFAIMKVAFYSPDCGELWRLWYLPLTYLLRKSGLYGLKRVYFTNGRSGAYTETSHGDEGQDQRHRDRVEGSDDRDRAAGGRVGRVLPDRDRGHRHAWPDDHARQAQPVPDVLPRRQDGQGGQEGDRGHQPRLHGHRRRRRVTNA